LLATKFSKYLAFSLIVAIAIGFFTGWQSGNANPPLPLAISQSIPFNEQIAQFLPELPAETPPKQATSYPPNSQLPGQGLPSSATATATPQPAATHRSIAALQKLAQTPNNKTVKIPKGEVQQDDTSKQTIDPIARRYSAIAKAAGYTEIYPEVASTQLVPYQGQQLQSDAARAFDRMRTAAAADGLELRILSGFRSIQAQVQIFDGKGGGLQAAEYSAPPGHSQHHTGLAIDINSLSPSFRQTKAFTWLYRNAGSYGFMLPYIEGPGDLGPRAEPWHWVYVGKPSAMKLMAGFLQRARQNSRDPLRGDRQLEAIYRSIS
jgi:LAS superfamily LD-carboxypeptidase LdcB